MKNCGEYLRDDLFILANCKQNFIVYLLKNLEWNQARKFKKGEKKLSCWKAVTFSNTQRKSVLVRAGYVLPLGTNSNDKIPSYLLWNEKQIDVILGYLFHITANGLSYLFSIPEVAAVFLKREDWQEFSRSSACFSCVPWPQQTSLCGIRDVMTLPHPCEVSRPGTYRSPNLHENAHREKSWLWGGF